MRGKNDTGLKLPDGRVVLTAEDAGAGIVLLDERLAQGGTMRSLTFVRS